VQEPEEIETEEPSPEEQEDALAELNQE